MDEISKNLIKLLQKDGRRNNKSLAAALGVSHATIQRRIKNMLQNNLIQFSTLINPNVFGSPMGVIIALQTTQRENENIVSRLTQAKNTMIVARATGRFNILALALFTNFDELCDFILNELMQIEGVVNTDLFPLLHLYQIGGHSLNLNVDSLDLKLIELLSHDGRQSSVELSKRLQVSPTTIQRRLSNLIDHEVFRVFASIDDTKVDWYWPAVIGLRVENKQMFDVLSTLRKSHLVKFASCTSGRYSIIAVIEATSRNDLYDFVEDEVSQIDGVKDSELFTSRGVIFCPFSIA